MTSRFEKSTTYQSDTSEEKHIVYQLDSVEPQVQALSPNAKGDEIDAYVDQAGVNAATFAHLDIKRILLKIDFRLIPMLTLLYLLSFLDRGNIGNAKIEGMTDDLHIQPDQYNWCLTAFFFTYCAFEVPSNMMLKRLRPSIWLPSIMVAWGIVMTLMGLVRDYHGLLIARIFLGVAEAGLFPGVSFYITMWYCRYETQWRQAIFFSAASIAGAFSGLLAYGISFMDGVGKLEGWRWIFILEGILTVLVAVSAFFLVHDFPETASFLTAEERAFVTWRLRYDRQDLEADATLRIHEKSSRNWSDVRAAFLDWQCWASVVVYWGYVCPLYGISLFLPSIIKELGYQSTTAQLLTVPIYITASIITIIVAWFADKQQHRSTYILVGLLFQIVGFAMCYSTSSAAVTYAGIFIAACAIYQCQPCNVTWLSNNLSGSYKRAVGMGIQISVGNLAGAMASNFYRQGDSPRYRLGHALELGFISVGVVAISIMIFSYKRINSVRAKKVANKEHNGYTPEELSDLGDKAITFRYTL